ncbi:hypothetical protein Tco_1265482 [Tanacetum coccineum]
MSAMLSSDATFSMEMFPFGHCPKEMVDVSSNNQNDRLFGCIKGGSRNSGGKRLTISMVEEVWLSGKKEMTTSVVTNSVFRDFLEKQKLSGPNFIDWYRQLRIVLSVMDKLDYIEQPIPPAPVPAQAGQQVAPEALAAHAAWVKGSKEIA